MEILCTRKIALLENRHQENLRSKLPTEVTLGKFPEISDALEREKKRNIKLNIRKVQKKEVTSLL
jgi:hypothetical protein